MGTGGQLAVDFAELMQEMWSSDSSLSAVHPKRFKATLGRFKPQVSVCRYLRCQRILVGRFLFYIVAFSLKTTTNKTRKRCSLC